MEVSFGQSPLVVQPGAVTGLAAGGPGAQNARDEILLALIRDETCKSPRLLDWTSMPMPMPMPMYDDPGASAGSVLSMQQEDPSDGSSLGKDLANVVKALAPLARNRFPNVRRAVRRLAGDVSDAALDALIARLQRYRTHQQLETINEIVKTSGLPGPVVARALADQKRIDELLASALEVVAGHYDDGAVPAASGDSTTPEDWFDVYKREATDRSEGDLREAFIRILAGEIQRPGTFSVRALRVLGMLDQGTASLFRKAVSVSVRLEIPFMDGRLSGYIQDVRIPALGGSLDQNCLAGYGFDYRALSALTEAELLHSEYASSANYGPATPPHPTEPDLQFPMVHQGSMWLLIPQSPDRQGVPVSVTGAMFTRVGRELLRIVDIEETPSFTEQLQQHFESQGYSMIPHKVTDHGCP